MIVLETRDASGRERRVAFGISVFVGDEFTADLAWRADRSFGRGEPFVAFPR